MTGSDVTSSEVTGSDPEVSTLTEVTWKWL